MKIDQWLSTGPAIGQLNSDFASIYSTIGKHYMEQGLEDPAALEF